MRSAGRTSRLSSDSSFPHRFTFALVPTVRSSHRAAPVPQVVSFVPTISDIHVDSAVKLRKIYFKSNNRRFVSVYSRDAR